MFDLKPITAAGIPAALQKAERYRLLNDSAAAESICLDVLELQPDNQQALVMLVLSIADQISEGLADGVRRARAVLPRLADEYERSYYNGIICERHAKGQLHHGGPRSHEIAYDWFREAMTWYEKAESMRPAGNDDPILRWNSCVRILSRNEHLVPAREERYEPELE